MAKISVSLVLAASHIPLVPTAWAVLDAFMLFILGTVALIALARALDYSVSIGAGLYFWHTGFGLAYALYVKAFGGDATSYYLRGLHGGTSFKFGTAAVINITGYITRVTGASFLGVSVIYNVAGAIGLMLLFDVLISITSPEERQVSRLVWTAVLMPSASFWTSGLGKDSLAFLSVAMLTWAALKMNRRYPAVVAAIALMFIIRPHIAGVMLVTLLAAAIGTPRRQIMARIVHACIVAAVITVALPVVTNYLGLEDAQNLQDVNSYIERRQSYNQEGDAGIDISRLPTPVQMATYLYRPLPYEAWSIFALMASIENLFLIWLTVRAANNLLHGGYNRLAGRSMFLWLYLLGGSYILATTTANLGIAVRQKWMIMPPLLTLLFATIGKLKSGTLDPADPCGQDAASESAIGQEPASGGPTARPDPDPRPRAGAVGRSRP